MRLSPAGGREGLNGTCQQASGTVTVKILNGRQNRTFGGAVDGAYAPPRTSCLMRPDWQAVNRSGRKRPSATGSRKTVIEPCQACRLPNSIYRGGHLFEMRWSATPLGAMGTAWQTVPWLDAA